MVTNGIKNSPIKCQTLFSLSVLITTEYAAAIPRINGHISAKASSSHFEANSCEVYAFTSSITVMRVTAHITAPIIFERFELFISKFSLIKQGSVCLKKRRMLFPAFRKDIFINIPFRVRGLIYTNYNTFFQKNNREKF